MSNGMDAYKLCSADKDLNPATCKFSNKCKPGYERDEKFLCKKNADPKKDIQELKTRLSTFMETGKNATRTLGLTLEQKHKMYTKKNNKDVSKQIEKMMEQMKAYKAQNPSKRARTKKAKEVKENRMVIYRPIAERSNSRSRSLSNRKSNGSNRMNRQNSIGSVNSSVKGYNQYAAKGRKPVKKYQNEQGTYMGTKI
jgi:hypothetical protein